MGVIRRAGTSDVEELVRLRHRMFQAMASTGAAGRPDEVEDSSWYPAARKAFLDQMSRTVLAAFVVDDPSNADPRGESGHSLVACAVVTIEERLPGPGFPRGTGGSMSSVFVEPAYRGCGLARAVVDAGVAWLDEQGVEVIDLHATREAEGLYRSLGFEEGRSLALRRLRGR